MGMRDKGCNGEIEWCVDVEIALVGHQPETGFVSQCRHFPDDRFPSPGVDRTVEFITARQVLATAVPPVPRLGQFHPSIPGFLHQGVIGRGFGVTYRNHIVQLRPLGQCAGSAGNIGRHAQGGGWLQIKQHFHLLAGLRFGHPEGVTQYRWLADGVGRQLGRTFDQKVRSRFASDMQVAFAVTCNGNDVEYPRSQCLFDSVSKKWFAGKHLDVLVGQSFGSRPCGHNAHFHVGSFVGKCLIHAIYGPSPCGMRGLQLTWVTRCFRRTGNRYPVHSESVAMQDVRVCRVAFVGAGGMIAEHVKAFEGLEGVEFCAIYNRTRQKAQEIASRHGIGSVFDDLDEMLDTARPDLVVMAVYEPAIFDVASKILDRPVAIFMEKPIGLDLAEARKLHALVKAKGRQVWVGLNRRTLGATQAALSDLMENDGPRFIEVQDQQSLETARVIGHVESVVDNWMYANSIHLVDYLTAFGRGEVSDVAVLQPWTPENPGVVLAHVRFSSGDTGVYQGIWNGPGPWACTVSAPHRRWEMRPLEKAVFQNAGERSLNEVPLSDADKDYKPGFRLQAEQVLAAWQGKATRAATIDDALKSTELVAWIFGIEDR